MAILNKVSGVVVGQFGEPITLQAIDDDGIAIDLSVYTAALIRTISPDAQTTLQFTGAFVSATGGTFSLTPSTGSTFTQDGDWDAQVQFSDTGVLNLTIPFIFEVSKQI